MHLVLPAMNCDNIYEMLSTREAYQKLSSWGFCWEPVMQAPPVQLQQNRRLPEGKQVFNVNHVICRNSLGTMNHVYKRIVVTFPKYKFSCANQGPALQAGLSEDSTLRHFMLTLFCSWCSLQYLIIICHVSLIT